MSWFSSCFVCSYVCPCTVWFFWSFLLSVFLPVSHLASLSTAQWLLEDWTGEVQPTQAGIKNSSPVSYTNCGHTPCSAQAAHSLVVEFQRTCLSDRSEPGGGRPGNERGHKQGSYQVAHCSCSAHLRLTATIQEPKCQLIIIITRPYLKHKDPWKGSFSLINQNSNMQMSTCVIHPTSAPAPVHSQWPYILFLD